MFSSLFRLVVRDFVLFLVVVVSVVVVSGVVVGTRCHRIEIRVIFGSRRSSVVCFLFHIWVAQLFSAVRCLCDSVFRSIRDLIIVGRAGSWYDSRDFSDQNHGNGDLNTK